MKLQSLVLSLTTLAFIGCGITPVDGTSVPPADDGSGAILATFEDETPSFDSVDALVDPGTSSASFALTLTKGTNTAHIRLTKLAHPYHHGLPKYDDVLAMVPFVEPPTCATVTDTSVTFTNCGITFDKGTVKINGSAQKDNSAMKLSLHIERTHTMGPMAGKSTTHDIAVDFTNIANVANGTFMDTETRGEHTKTHKVTLTNLKIDPNAPACPRGAPGIHGKKFRHGAKNLVDGTVTIDKSHTVKATNVTKTSHLVLKFSPGCEVTVVEKTKT